MVVLHKVDGYDDFYQLMSHLDGKGSILVLFCGSKNSDGYSWCPDCKEAEPVIQKVLRENEDRDFHYVYVGVGPKPVWKDPKCPFRVDPKVKLTSVPTLLQWGTPRRLGDTECQDIENIKLMFEEL